MIATKRCAVSRAARPRASSRSRRCGTSRGGRNWEIPNVVLGDSLISDVDRAVITVHRQLGRQFHLVEDA